MPVILSALPDPPDRVIAGASLALPAEPFRWEQFWAPLINDLPDRLPMTPPSLVVPLFAYGMIDQGTRQFDARLPDQAVEKGIRINACLCTPTGAVIQILMGSQWFWNDTGQTTRQFSVTGVTKDAAGSALGNCRVVVLETGQLAVTGAPVVAEGQSDGSGNYAILVPLNTAYQVIAYKPGSPDVAGITRADVVPNA